MTDQPYTPTSSQPTSAPAGPPGPAAPKTPGMAVASLVLGIVALCTGWIPYVNFASLVMAIVAVVLGHMALNQIKADPVNVGGRGLAVAGLVLGYIVIGFVVLMIILLLVVGVALLGAFQGVYCEEYPDDPDCQAAWAPGPVVDAPPAPAFAAVVPFAALPAGRGHLLRYRAG